MFFKLLFYYKKFMSYKIINNLFIKMENIALRNEKKSHYFASARHKEVQTRIQSALRG